MKSFTKAVVAAAVAAAVSAGIASAQHEQDVTQIQRVLSAYEKALNASDADAVLKLYASDGVFMPQHSPPNVGSEAIRAAYDHVFSSITLSIEFEVDEVTQMSPSWAFARTRSEGTVKVNATGDGGPEANQELFLFKKSDDGNWKIARYIFATTNPPRE